ncbi:CII family transcriptional regulator [Pantoea agglomerans]|uniref:CII family transcriptional regulator n=1 Tax=Enterobacter agglomerans TaxID=549 RepID=UPI001CCEB88B|nr:CII family transcriptional regulator [Pantoea agglomerans]UBN53069.1 lambda phage CII family protein [Pantoea agglomerans]
MEIASYRKKAREIESQLLNKLAERGQGTLAKVLDMDEATISRMKRRSGMQKHSFFQMMSLAMAYLDVVSPESEVAQRLLRIEQLLTKEKAPSCANSFEA